MSSPRSFTRREFFKWAGTVGGGSLLAATGAMAQGTGGAAAGSPGALQVATRAFGKSGVQVSMLSLGGMFDITSNQLLLKQALQFGVTYWDTADCYNGGKSEQGIGQFFEKYPETRKKVFLVTKSDARDPEGISKLLEQSLSRLKTDSIDLYFIHGVSKIKELTNETKTWAEKAKASGKIKLFGFSTHSNMEELMQSAAKMGWIDGIMMTYNFRIMQSNAMKSTVDACVRAGIGLTAMKTQGGGSVKTESETELRMAGRFLQQGYNDKQAKLKAVWENPNIASLCSQMPSTTILMSNVAAALNQTKLSADEWSLFHRYARETACSYCAGCAQICEAAVGLPIRDVMRHLMYHHSYGEHEVARTWFAQLPEDTRRNLVMADYSAVERRCPQGMAIGEMMRSAGRILA
ncbi:MAG TPA: aldo/keto reductase [Syntrophobacteraceae bacterium]|nr:aldo/keto reductase [Syntrophobacteraceae bacterium]